MTIAAEERSIADLLRDLGDIPAKRVRSNPPPGTATIKDLIAIDGRGIPCELVDGTLVEKAVGFRESTLAGMIIEALQLFIRPRKLGLVTGEGGMMKILTGLVRIPDVAFVSWSRLPGGIVPKTPVPGVVPDLAVEILSPGNTKKEMARKLREYATAGVRLIWIVDPEKRTIAVYSGLDRSQFLGENDTLDGGDVLPGFKLAVRSMFSELDQTGPEPPAKPSYGKKKNR